MSRRDDAKQSLRYYLRKAWEAAGLEWGSDNDAEVDNIVDDIAQSAIEP